MLTLTTFEFAMGGTLKKLTEDKNNQIWVAVMSDSSTVDGNDGILKELHDSMDFYGLPYSVYTFITMYFTRDYQQIRDRIFSLKSTFKPDIVYSTSNTATHPDHRVVGEAVHSIFLEKQTVIFYNDVRGNYNQNINHWEILTKEQIDFKINALLKYESQHRRAYLDSVGLKSISKSRGMQIGADYCEGFEIYKSVGL